MVVLRSLIALAVACATAGCGVAPEEPESDAFAALVSGELERADLQPEVRDILLDAQQVGELTFEGYRQAGELWVECVADLGFAMRLVSVTAEGQERFAAALEYPEGVTSSEDPRYEGLTISASNCRMEFFEPVESVYIRQPAAVELRSDYFDTFRESTWACLVEHDSDLPRDSSVDEFQVESNLISERTGVDCLYDAGFYPDISSDDFD